MADLKYTEKQVFEKLFEMGGGYVLDFSDSSFGSFFKDFKVDIHSEKYTTIGTSKAKKLRSFWEQESDNLVGNTMRELVAYVKMNGGDRSLVEQCEVTINRLLGEQSKNEEVTEDQFISANFEYNLDHLRIESTLRDIIEQRLNEIAKCYKSGAYLSVIFLCGSTLEGLLLNHACFNPEKYNKAKSAPKKSDGMIKQFQNWTLNSFIDVSYECRFIKKDIKDYSHSLRNFRNYIHPHRQMSESFSPDEHTAKISWQVLSATIADLSNKR